MSSTSGRRAFTSSTSLFIRSATFAASASSSEGCSSSLTTPGSFAATAFISSTQRAIAARSTFLSCTTFQTMPVTPRTTAPRTTQSVISRPLPFFFGLPSSPVSRPSAPGAEASAFPPPCPLRTTCEPPDAPPSPDASAAADRWPLERTNFFLPEPEAASAEPVAASGFTGPVPVSFARIVAEAPFGPCLRMSFTPERYFSMSPMTDL